jgi:hypothetical protein
MTQAIYLPANLRRANLLNWIRERPEHSGLTAREITELCPDLYAHVLYKVDACTDDLRNLWDRGLVDRNGWKPARWFA